MKETAVDFSKRYWVGHGTSVYRTFDTAAELNTWHDAQNTDERYFCRLYDTKKNISVLGSAYMFFDEAKRWKDNALPPEVRSSVINKLKQPSVEHKTEASKSKEPEL